MSETGRTIMGRRIPVTTGLVRFFDQIMAGLLRTFIVVSAWVRASGQ